MTSQKRYQEAIKELSSALVLYPDNISIKRQLALVYYEMEDWSRAESAIAEVLQKNSKDGEFILMRARMFVEQKQFTHAQTPLDLYATINPNNALYLFLRAQVQADGYRNRDAALNYLRSMLKSPSVDDTMSAYAAKLLMESNRQEEQKEGRDLLQKLLSKENPSLSVIDIALTDAILQKKWNEARTYIKRVLGERRSANDLFNAYTVEHGSGNNAAALSYARELYQQDTSNNDGCVAYISALIDTGRLDEAAKLIDSRLNSAQGTVKARYYYLRSRTKTNEEARLSDLRSSLFEDPRNLNSLVTMFNIYHSRNDRRALSYLKQALAITPNDPQLRRYEKEYE
jgi:thioredoxin-like negative regulator of GroEL